MKMILSSGYVENIIENVQLHLDNIQWEGRLAIILAIVAVLFIIRLIFSKAITPAINKVVKKTKFTWDDILFCSKTIKTLCRIVQMFTLNVLLPIALYGEDILLDIASKVCEIGIISLFIRLLLEILNSVYEISQNRDITRNRPLKGIYQMIQVIIICIGIILIFSSLFDKSPIDLLVGLSAAATVLMLVFKDSIVGLVSGVQLSANDMLRPGDWIVLESGNVDGVVTEVNLTTVKVRNWDNTIVTVPPYTLVSESFTNWRGMEESEGRRVKRSIRLDMMCINLCTKEEIEKYKAEGLIADGEDTSTITNSTIFRRYMLNFLKNHSKVNSNMTLLVRLLQPDDEGLPLEFYFFTIDKRWAQHEELQSDIMDYAIAIAPKFGLKVYQRPSAPLNRAN